MPLLASLRGQAGLPTLLRRHLAVFLVLFLCLQGWRSHYFLTDDNLSGVFPALTEAGRHMENGRWPFFSDDIFGGHYLFLRDISYNYWHPFYLLPAFLADTPARFWMVDLAALLFLLLTLVGFTLLAHRLREEFNPALPDGYLGLYTFSYLFSTYILTIGASWINFLPNQAALPWLALGILERRLVPGAGLVALFTVHEILGGYPPLGFTCGLCLTLFALGIAIDRRSPRPMFAWIVGNLAALVVTAPYLQYALDGFAHTLRLGGYTAEAAATYSIPNPTFTFSLFLGNWSPLATRWMGDPALHTFTFPYLSTLLACAAAWCVLPALAVPLRWRFPEVLCLALALFTIVLIARPFGVSALVTHLPFLRSFRWPFREGLEFLFFLHLFLLVRPPLRMRRVQAAFAALSLAAFLLPLPFIPVPTFYPLALDRQLLFSGRAETFWRAVKTRLGPGDEVASVVPMALWQSERDLIPYSLLDTADFPEFFQVRSISGYSPTAPLDQVPLRKLVPAFWFGSFDTVQIPDLLATKPDLKLIEVAGVKPLRIVLVDHGKITDLTPLIPR